MTASDSGHIGRVLLFLGLVFAASGCVPYPHRYQYLPKVEGRVTRAGIPIGSVRVFLHYRDTDDRRPGTGCEETPEAGATTTEDGRFVMEGERRLRLYIGGV